ncbi:hypothetical protein A1O1_08023 [Capronia coronata CBS 617.96]|uniref:Aldehyde dehydrogenase domain-containing protein n=1 Tax=Capronia coronata CBS 617.96 TaxID=1182541 RepID=W9XYD2_9EURO|nr:uncharacterized protein A1O1_08023 [Capronia coronata CBS 617.96]EXJ81956.1 hypothetical protein A1O1_08023 [Capronia coronata CBS 617.96]
MSGQFVVPLIINGEDVRSKETFPIVNPRTGETLWQAASATTDQANAAAAAGQAAFPAWSQMTYLARRDVLLKAADVMEEHLEELKRYDCEEMGAEMWWATFDTATAMAMIRDVAGRISSIEGTLTRTLEPGSMAMVMKIPYGVVFGITPWNAACLSAVRCIIYALAAGNTVVLKSSELSTRLHFLIGDCFRKAGCPPGVVNVIAHSREAGPAVIGALIEHPAIRKINFTGSTAVGKILAQQAAKAMKPILLELGGKAPMIVLEDADLKEAAHGAAFGANFNAGQNCMATERIIVIESVAKEFEEVLKATYAELYPDSYQPQPAVQLAGANKVKSLVDEALATGSEIMFGKKPEGGQVMHPIILKNTQNSKIHYDETFGPSVNFVVVPSVEAAIEAANDTVYGLTAAIWSKDLAKALKVATQIESGAVHINHITVHDDLTLPHGGVKESGMGRFGASWGINEFLTLKSITFKI